MTAINLLLQSLPEILIGTSISLVITGASYWLLVVLPSKENDND